MELLFFVFCSFFWAVVFLARRYDRVVFWTSLLMIAALWALGGFITIIHAVVDKRPADVNLLLAVFFGQFPAGFTAGTIARHAVEKRVERIRKEVRFGGRR